jgi:hypothetical protein
MPVYFWPSYSLNSSYETAASLRDDFLRAAAAERETFFAGTA